MSLALLSLFRLSRKFWKVRLAKERPMKNIQAHPKMVDYAQEVVELCTLNQAEK
jgi:hypothetical protein